MMVRYVTAQFPRSPGCRLLSPGLELQHPLLPRHLEGVGVVLVGRLQDLHAVEADAGPHRVLGPPQAELGHAVQQHVVELTGDEIKEEMRYVEES